MLPENDQSGVAIAGENYPADVREIFARLDAAFPKMHDRRLIPRWLFHTEAFLTVDHSARHQLWTRDINPWNVGYVSRERLVSGTNGTLRFEVPGGQIVVVAGQVKRCREFTPGWYEGFINFMQSVPEDAIEKTRS